MTTREEMIEKAQIYLHALGSVSTSSDAESERTADFALSVERAAFAAAREALADAERIHGEAREMLIELSDYARGVESKALLLTLDHIDEHRARVRAALRMLEPEKKPDIIPLVHVKRQPPHWPGPHPEEKA